MTTEIMAECLEEARDLTRVGPVYDELGGDLNVPLAMERVMVATIAVGLYQERMKGGLHEEAMFTCSKCGWQAEDDGQYGEEECNVETT